MRCCLLKPAEIIAVQKARNFIFCQGRQYFDLMLLNLQVCALIGRIPESARVTVHHFRTGVGRNSFRRVQRIVVAGYLKVRPVPTSMPRSNVPVPRQLPPPTMLARFSCPRGLEGRLGEGSALRRMTYAFVQTFVTHTDDGRQTFNYGGWIGRALGASMTYIYYPEPSRNGGVVLRTFGTSLGGLTAYDEFREFLPRAIFTKLDIFR